MTSQATFGRMIEHFDAEMEVWGKLEHMLEEQFAVALKLDTHKLAHLVKSIEKEMELLAELARKRHQFSEIFQKPLPPMSARAHTTKRELPASATTHKQQCAVFEMHYDQLKKLVQHCRELILRNGHLLASQYEIMQRILHGERHTYPYVPA